MGLPGEHAKLCDGRWREAIAISRRDTSQPSVTPVVVVIGLVTRELALKIAAVPKQRPIHIFAAYRSDQALNECMGTRCARHGFDLVNLEYAQIRAPSLKAKQLIVIRRKVLREGLLGDHVIEHPADGRTIETHRGDPKADNAAGVKTSITTMTQ
jgi:hypothetical protein